MSGEPGHGPWPQPAPQPGPQWLTPQWPVAARVRALSTLRVGGVSLPPCGSLNLGAHVEDDPAAVAENRRLLRTAAQLPAEPAWLRQVHGTAVSHLDSPVGGRGGVDAGPADAAVARSPGRVCAVLTADCLPVLLATAAGDRVGAAHAGWRGLAAGVIEATVRALGGAPSDLVAWLGPAIGPRCFEVGAEVREALLGGSGGAGDETAFAPSARGRFLADLYALARGRLQRAGVARVFGGGECTYTEGSKYFSHRRDGRTGRQATLIWLESLPHR
jgi:hypothetical protein